jgi:hypothetical protein
VLRDVEVQDLTTSVLDHEEAVQQSKVDRRNREEVEGDSRFSVILQERQPVFPRITPPSDAPQIAGDAAFGNDEAELLQLPLGRAPIRILFCQAPDQQANLFGDLRPAAAGPRAPAPVEPETGAVPADDGFRLHDDKNVRPAGPKAAESGPEESVQPVNHGVRTFAFEHRNLLSEGEDFESCITPTAKENSEG